MEPTVQTLTREITRLEVKIAQLERELEQKSHSLSEQADQIAALKQAVTKNAETSIAQ